MGIIVTIAIIAILVCLGAAGYFLVQGGGDTEAQNEAEGRNKRMARALAVRVALSVALFLGIMLSWAMGWIAPTGLPV